MTIGFEDIIKPIENIECDSKMGIAPIVGAMCEALAIPETINRLFLRDASATLDHGLIVKAFIIDLLTQRSPLLHFAKNMEQFDTEVLFGSDVLAKHFTQARLERTLHVIASIDDRAVMSELSLGALHMHGTPGELMHFDTTNYELDGTYSEDIDDAILQIKRGRSKSSRTKEKVVGLGMSVQQDGLPVFGEVLDGNTSDAVWFRDAMDEVARFTSGTLADNPILVYDAAASNEATFDLSFDHKVPCIIRLSRSFNIANEAVDQAWAEDRWENIGVVATENKSNASEYRIFSGEATLGKSTWRLLVVHSSSLEKQKQTTLARGRAKMHDKLSKAASTLATKGHPSEAEAQKAADKFLRTRKTQEKLLSYTVEIEPRTIEKYDKPGRPGPNAKKIRLTSYHAVVSFGDYDPERYQEWLRRQSCFSLVTNVPTKRRPDSEILQEYQRQWKVESVFEFTKTPLILAPIWLHRPRRIKSLLFIVWLAVLVATYIRYRFRQSLQQVRNASEAAQASPRDQEKDHQEEDKTPVHTETPSLEGAPDDGPLSTESFHQLLHFHPSGTVALPGNRNVTNPTFKRIGDLTDELTITSYPDAHQEPVRLFHTDTQEGVVAYIICAGFSPSVYLEPFRPSHDLWNYAPA